MLNLFENNLGKSHQCQECGKIFLQNEDGCPDCGIGARVLPLNQINFDDYKEVDCNSVDFYVMFHDTISNQILILTEGASIEIRINDPVEKEFVYWIVVSLGEPQYFFSGDRSYLI